MQLGYHIVGRVRDWSSSYLVGVRNDRRWMAFSRITGKSSGIHRFIFSFPSSLFIGSPPGNVSFQTFLLFFFILFNHLSQSRGIIPPALPLFKNDLLLSIAQLCPRFFFLFYSGMRIFFLFLLS